MLGVLGGGQLGAMFAQAAVRLNYRVAVWDPDPDAPAHRLASYSFPSLFDDPQTFMQFAGLVSVVTYEWENVPAALCEQLERTKPVRPASGVLRLIQNRLVQKTFLAGQGFPVPRFTALTEPNRLPEIIGAAWLPCDMQDRDCRLRRKGAMEDRWAVVRVFGRRIPDGIFSQRGGMDRRKLCSVRAGAFHPRGSRNRWTDNRLSVGRERA